MGFDWIKTLIQINSYRPLSIAETKCRVSGDALAEQNPSISTLGYLEGQDSLTSNG